MRIKFGEPPGLKLKKSWGFPRRTQNSWGQVFGGVATLPHKKIKNKFLNPLKIKRREKKNRKILKKNETWGRGKKNLIQKGGKTKRTPKGKKKPFCLTQKKKSPRPPLWEMVF